MTGFFEGTEGRPTPIPHELDDHIDVTLTAPAEGDVLRYNSTDEDWTNQPLYIESLTNVNTIGAADGDLLSFDSGTQTWIPSPTMGGGGSGAVDSVNGATGVVVLTTDSIDDSTAANKYVSAAERSAISATEAGLASHLINATDAHDASAISFINSGTGLSSTDAQAALQALAAGTGSGQMAKSVYDPTEVNGDVFDMDNMVEGVNTKILTSSERETITRVDDKAIVFGLDRADDTGPIVIFAVGVSILLGHTPYHNGPYAPNSRHYDYRQISGSTYGFVQAPDLSGAHRADYVLGGPEVGMSCGGYGDILYGLVEELTARFPKRNVYTVRLAVGGCSIKQLEGVLYQDGVLQSPIDNNIYDLAEIHFNNAKSLLAAVTDAPAYPDYVLWNIGPKEALKTDAITGLPNADYMSPTEFAERALRVISTWDNPDVLDYISPDTKFILLDCPEFRAWDYEGAHLKVLANIMGPRAMLIRQKDVPLEDFIHPTGDGSIEIGRQIGQCITGVEEASTAYLPGKIVRNKTDLLSTVYQREADGTSDVSTYARWKYDPTNGLLIINPHYDATHINWGWFGLRHSDYVLIKETANAAKKVYLKVTGRPRFSPTNPSALRIPVSVQSVGASGWPDTATALTLSMAKTFYAATEITGDLGRTYTNDSEGYLSVDSKVTFEKDITFDGISTFENDINVTGDVGVTGGISATGDITSTTGDFNGINLTLTGDVISNDFWSNLNIAGFGAGDTGYYVYAANDGFAGGKYLSTTGKFYGLPASHAPITTAVAAVSSGTRSTEAITGTFSRLHDFLNADVTKAYVAKDGSFVSRLNAGALSGFIFADPSNLALPGSGVFHDEPTDVVSLRNYTTTPSYNVAVGPDFIAFNSSLTAYNCLSVVDESGVMALVAGNMSSPAVAARTFKLRTTGNTFEDGANGSIFNSLVGTLNRSVYTTSTGKIQSTGRPVKDFINASALNVTVNTITGLYAPPAMTDGERLRMDFTVTANRRSTLGTYCGKFSLTIARDSGVITCSEGTFSSNLVTLTPYDLAKQGTSADTLAIKLYNAFGANSIVCYGNSGETWDFYIEGVSISIV